MKKYISIILTFLLIMSGFSLVNAEHSTYDVAVDEVDEADEKDMSDVLEKEADIPKMAISIEEISPDATKENTEETEPETQDEGIMPRALDDSWASKAALTVRRANANFFSINGELYAVGGYGEMGYVSTIEKYNDITNTWQNITEIPNTPKGFASVAAEGKIYIIGGYRDGTYLNDVQVYDTEAQTWSELQGMNKKRDLSCALYTNNRLYVFGGQDDDGIVESYEYYSFSNQRWSTISYGINKSICRIGAKAMNIDGYTCIYGGITRNNLYGGVSLYSGNNLSNEESIVGDNLYDDISIAWGMDKALIFASQSSSNAHDVTELTIANGEILISNPKFNKTTAKQKYSEFVIYNGYLYCIGGFNKTSKLYLNNVNRYSVFYGDLITGEGNIDSVITDGGSEITFNAEADKEYVLFINAENISSFDGYTFAIDYDEDVFNIVDGCALTESKDTAVRPVAGTDIAITRKDNKGISFICTEQIDYKVSKTVNAVILKANTTGQRTITYSMIREDK